MPVDLEMSGEWKKWSNYLWCNRLGKAVVDGVFGGGILDLQVSSRPTSCRMRARISGATSSKYVFLCRWMAVACG